MSVACDLSTLYVPTPEPRPRLRAVPDVPLPTTTPGGRRAGAEVAVLRRPVGADAVQPLRLTRRGVVVVTALVLLLGAALVWVASLFAPQAAPAPVVPAAVTVHAGDTLWSLAARYAGSGDPQAFVARVEQRNHLLDAQVVPGQVLRLR